MEFQNRQLNCPLQSLHAYESIKSVLCMVLPLNTNLRVDNGASNKVSNIIRRHIDNRKLLLIRISLLADSFIVFRFYFYQYMVVLLFPQL
jgi:hypothetical protein